MTNLKKFVAAIFWILLALAGAGAYGIGIAPE